MRWRSSPRGPPRPSGGHGALVGSLTQRHRDWLLAAGGPPPPSAGLGRRFFDQWDVLLAPVCVTAAIAHDTRRATSPSRTVTVDGVERPYLDLMMWTTMIGSAELPSTVVPVGRTPDGLPVGIQVVGPHLEDRTTLAAARIVEGLTGGYQPPPLVTN